MSPSGALTKTAIGIIPGPMLRLAVTSLSLAIMARCIPSLPLAREE
jgi:hypothetical protein